MGSVPVFLLLLMAAPAAAQPVRCTDAAGKTIYLDASSAKNNPRCQALKGSASVVESVAPAKPAAKAGGGGAAPGNPGEAVAAAQRRLEQARRALAEQEAIREGAERNYARVQERLAPYQAEVEAAERALQEARGANAIQR